MRTRDEDMPSSVTRAHALEIPQYRCQEPLGELLANHPSRREFMRFSCLAAGATGLCLAATGSAAAQPASERKPDAVLARLIAGNERFAKGQLLHPGRRPEDFLPLAEGQARRPSSSAVLIHGLRRSHLRPGERRPVRGADRRQRGARLRAVYQG